MKKAFVGMSGGVDSSTSAALLVRAGYDVTGVFIKAWEPPVSGSGCTWRDERRDAMRVAAQLKIPLVTLDLEADYKREVVDEMLREYRAGRTPNPDVACNEKIKFGAFYRQARAAGADIVATGHYARTRHGQLQVSVDQEKDQTYFLWTLTRDQLEHIQFPIGGYTKAAVRRLARSFKLPTAEKKDSQGLCFIGPLDVKAFLKAEIGERPGAVVDERGIVVGQHDGVWFYTIGERHGFSAPASGPEAAPYYIVRKDVAQNQLIVSSDPVKAFLTQSAVVTLERCHWINEAPQPETMYRARVRYRQPLQSCTITLGAGETAVVRFEQSQFAVAAGQSLVLYDGETCLGGGVVV